MTLSEKLTPIGEKFNLGKGVLPAVQKFLQSLRKQDIISAPLLSRKAKISVSLAEKLLPELVNIGVLTYFIVVACDNPDLDGDQIEHYQTFNSLKEFAQFSNSIPCPVCDCGFPFGTKARIGFKVAK